MTHPYLFVLGVIILCLLAPELIVAGYKVKIPLIFNVLSAIGGGLIAASFVL